MCPPMRAHWRHLANTIELVHSSPTWLHTPNRESIGSAVLHSSRQKVPILYNWRPYPPELPLPMGDVDPYLAYDSLGPCGSAVLHRWLQSVSILYNGSSVSLSKLPLPMAGSGPPESSTQPTTGSLRPFLQGSLVWLTDWPTNRPTDHVIRSVKMGRMYVPSTAMRRNNT